MECELELLKHGSSNLSLKKKETHTIQTDIK